MKLLQINVFKTTSLHGNTTGFDLISNYTNTLNCLSIGHSATCTVTCVKSFTQSCGEEQVSVAIDFKPIHDIEKQPNSNFKLCSSPTAEEQSEFWMYFCKQLVAEDSMKFPVLAKEALGMTIEEMVSHFPVKVQVRTFNCFQRVGCQIVADVLKYTTKELMNFRNYGKQSNDALEAFYEKMGIIPETMRPIMETFFSKISNEDCGDTVVLQKKLLNFLENQ